MPNVARVAIQFHKGSVSDVHLPEVDAHLAVNQAEQVALSSADLARGEYQQNAIYAGWHNTGKTFQAMTVRYTTEEDSGTDNITEGGISSIPSFAWGEVREVRFGVDRDYGGMNSSGGPRQSGRPDHRLITLVRNTDLISPALFKRCCNGLQLRRVVIYDHNNNLLIVGDNCHVVSYEYIGDKAPSTYYQLDQTGPSSFFSGTATTHSQEHGHTRHYERVMILYTSVAMSTNGGDSWDGWSTVNETSWNDPGYTVV